MGTGLSQSSLPLAGRLFLCDGLPMKKKITPSEALTRLRKLAGTDANLAKWAGRTRQAVSNWRKIPPECVLALEARAEVDMTRYQMRADIYGDAP